LSEGAGEAKINILIKAITAQKLDDKANHYTPVVFNFGVNMEESERKTDLAKIAFQMTMNTEPGIARFAIEGTAVITGEPGQIEKMLSADRETQVPEIFTRIYQQAYSVVFMLAGTIDVPYPSPALLKKPHVQAPLPGQV
jgi:hypothetical protein